MIYSFLFAKNLLLQGGRFPNLWKTPSPREDDLPTCGKLPPPGRTNSQPAENSLRLGGLFPNLWKTLPAWEDDFPLIGKVCNFAVAIS